MLFTRIWNRLSLTLSVLLKGDAVKNSRMVGQIRDIRPLTAEEITEARSFFPMDKFFIYGHARSGTTLLTRLIRLHPEVHCNYQAHFFSRPPLLHALVADPEVAAWLTRRSNRWNRGEDLSPVVLRAAADFILERDARREGAHIVGDKSPNSLMDGQAVKLLHQIYPDARLIYIVRDGRDVALSHRFQAFIDLTHYLSKEDLNIREAFIQDPEPFLKGERSIFTEKAIRQAAQNWVRNVSETDTLGKDLFPQGYISLRYQDLINKPWEEISRLWAFLGTDLTIDGLETGIQEELELNPDAQWQRQKANEIGDALNKGKKGSWRQIFTHRDREIFHQIAMTHLQNWGFER
jgi:hypothetical protein